MGRPHFFSCLNPLSSVRLLAAACIRRDGGTYPEPFESSFEIVEGFDAHAPVLGDVFDEPVRVKQRLFKNVGELCGRGHTPICEIPDRLGREFAVIETFHILRFSGKFPAIDENFLNFVAGNRLKNLQKSPLCILQRELPRLRLRGGALIRHVFPGGCPFCHRSFLPNVMSYRKRCGAIRQSGSGLAAQQFPFLCKIIAFSSGHYNHPRRHLTNSP